MKKGIFIHDVFISAAETEIIQAFFDLNFGKERVEALLDLGTLQIQDVPDPAGVTIRMAVKGDNEHLGRLSGINLRTLARPPYWHPTLPEEYAELQEGWAELADDANWTIWLAFENDRALGMVGVQPEPEEDIKMLAGPGTLNFTLGVTEATARGRGISSTLTWRSLAWARAQGYQTCYNNWISPNLLASRFWPRFGFTDAAYRLAKRIDPMIAWAGEK